MKRLVIGLLITSCYDPGATENAQSKPAPERPAAGALRIGGTIAARTEGSEQDTALAGVEACARADARALCVSSDDDGLYEVGPFLPNTHFAVRYEKAGYAPLVVEYDIPEHSIAGNVFLLSNESIEQTARRLGITHDPLHGAVMISVRTITYDGIVPLKGAIAGPLGNAKFTYASALHELDQKLDATTDSGWALAMGLPPGRYTLELAHLDRAATCGRLTGDMSRFQDSMDVEAVAGEISVATLYCFR